jgi:hypothetical protein
MDDSQQKGRAEPVATSMDVGDHLHDNLTEIDANDLGQIKPGLDMQTSAISTAATVVGAKPIKWGWWFAALIVGGATWVGIFSLWGST